MTDLVEINNCEVCDNNNLCPVLDLGNHAMCDDLKEIGSKLSCKKYPIHILLCERCKTAHQKYQIPKQELFPTNYHYRARFTKDVLAGMHDLVNKAKMISGPLSNKTVLDVGCNDGSLLNFFKQAGAICIGVEPTSAALDVVSNIDKVYNCFFDVEIANQIKKNYGQPDIITFTNVFAHIENLNSLLEALRILIGPNTKIIIENHYLGKVLDTNQFDTFYHEHPRTYSATSFKYIAEKLNMGLLDIEFPSRYGGNIRVTMDNYANSNNFNAIFSKESGYNTAFTNMQDFINNWKLSKKSELLDLKKTYSQVYAKALPGRACILIELLELNEDLISGVFEQDTSMKVGNLVPGTNIPILKDSQMQQIKPAILINMAWHIKNEIEAYLKTKNFTGELRHIV